ncbi:MAG TPA: hypothetical protein VH138_12675 [Vicinamibacterales bacterium]|jgi:hypothetical protein|nr:hypothetical protein [Vicinamibacterales bacterium]
MRLTRTAAAVAVLSCLAFPPAADASQRQPAPSPARTAQGATPAADPAAPHENADQVRNRLDELLREYPSSVGRVLAMDPTLIDNPTYLEPYPELAAFFAAHPEVKHNPGFYLSNNEFNFRGNPRLTPQDRALDMWGRAIEGFTIGAVVLTIAGGLFWLIKTMIEHRRWSRLSKIQTDVHNKLLDRFTTNEDLLAYIQTPVGRKFLESAPIPMDSPRSISAPVGRILWSAQAGAVLTVLGLGFEVVAGNAVEELSGPVAAMGAVVIALGIGFLLSALLAYLLSRRFGLMQHDAPAQEIRG